MFIASTDIFAPRFLLTLTFLLALTMSAQFDEAEARHTLMTEVDQTRAAIVQRINRLWRKLSHQEWEKIAEARGGKDVRLLEEFAKISDSLKDITVAPIPELVISPIWSYAIIQVESMGIIGLYKHFRLYQMSPAAEKNARKWQDFAENVVQDTVDTASVSKAMDRLDELIITNEASGIPRNIFDEIIQEVETNLCNVQQSPQQVLYNLYVSLQMTQLKGYTMMQFSWMLLRLYNKGNFTLEAQTSRDKYLARMKQQVQAAKNALENADQAMWRCDPRSYKEDETYTQLTRLLQGYIVNEVNLNNEKTCRETCGYYNHAKQYSCFDQFCNQQQSCSGKITDCRYIDSDMTICSADIRSHRRYNWIRYENGKVLGEEKSCTNVRKVDSWWRYLFWHCSYCFCICDDPKFSDRYFNLRPAVADIGNNRVITSVKFTKSDHVVHLQIEEGVLMAKGLVNESTVSWIPVDQYIVGTDSVRKGVDYHMMSWEERAIDLDDLVAPPNFVMTGVKFRLLGTHLNLEIRITPFNFTTGQLINPHIKSQWISNDNTDGSPVNPRKLYSMGNLDVPTQSPKASLPDTANDTFLLFTHASVDTDAAQHTIPFFDTQPVSPQPPTPLSGAGLFHKGTLKYGGFIAPKVYTYNMANHLQEDFDISK